MTRGGRHAAAACRTAPALAGEEAAAVGSQGLPAAPQRREPDELLVRAGGSPPGVRDRPRQHGPTWTASAAADDSPKDSPWTHCPDSVVQSPSGTVRGRGHPSSTMPSTIRSDARRLDGPCRYRRLEPSSPRPTTCISDSCGSVPRSAASSRRTSHARRTRCRQTWTGCRRGAPAIPIKSRDLPSLEVSVVAVTAEWSGIRFAIHARRLLPQLDSPQLQHGIAHPVSGRVRRPPNRASKADRRAARPCTIPVAARER